MCLNLKDGPVCPPAAETLPVSPAPPAGHDETSWANDGAVRYHMDNHGVSLDEAVDRIKLQGAGGPLMRAAATLFPATYAGAWLDHDNGVLKVAFTQNAQASRDVLAQTFPYPERLVAHTHPVALVNLEIRREDIESDLAVLETAIPSLRSITLMQDTNTILFRVAPGAVSAAQTFLAGRYIPSYETVVEFAPEPTGASVCTGASESAQRSNCPNPLRGGTLGTVARTGPQGQVESVFCTLGFAATATTGLNYILSAGHCTPTGWQASWRHNGKTIGIAAGSVEGGNMDALRVLVNNTYNAASNPNGWYTSRWVFANPNAMAYQIRERALPGQIPTSSVICKAGVTTNEQCGRITSDNSIAWCFSGCTGAPNRYTEQVEVLACADHGDSGGPIYGRVDANDPLFMHAIGLQTIFAGFGCFAGVTWGPRIRNVENALGVVVRTT